MFTAWILRTLALVTVIAVLLPLMSGDLEPVLQRCCQTGETWARNHTTCTGPPQESGNIPAPDRLTCLTSIYICCIRSHRRIECDRGKLSAREGRQCGSTDDTFRDCCDGCSLGIQAGIQRMPCGFLRFSFGAPWDEAYIDCCEKSSTYQGFAEQTKKAVCEPNAPCSQKCDIVENRVKCSCYPGFTLAADGAACTDVDECQLGTHTCNPVNELCLNLVGGFTCMSTNPENTLDCPPGLVKNQQTQACEDFDECTLKPCPGNVHCVNTYGSYLCDYLLPDKEVPFVQPCLQGFVYSQNNGICIDVDECSERIDKCNHTTEICQNSHGGYQCIKKPARGEDCPAGFKWNDTEVKCEDFDECRERLHDCDVDKNCRNTVGGYECEAKCFPLMKFDPLQNKCVDKHACADGLHDCKPDEACISALDDESGYVCIPKSGNNPCPPGFKPADGNSQLCDDINECEEFADVCDVEWETCINGIGSYDCIAKSHPSSQVQPCPPGFQSADGSTHCIDIDECLQNADRCNRSTHDCVNHNGTYECVAKAPFAKRCPPGYAPNPRTNDCEDINECIEGRHECQDNEQCVNVLGAYMCQEKSCPAGHKFNTTTNSCRDIDECVEGKHSCSPVSQNCVNAIGSYRCVNKATCPHGYRLTSRNKCEDVNECAEFLDDCDHRTQNCVNTDGSYQCQSKTPTDRNRVPNRPSCGTGYFYDVSRNICSDVDECDILNSCLEEQVCENTIGSYVCVCSQGFQLDALTRQCRDVNECHLGMHVCADSQRCDNTVGSYTCVRITSCGTGYTLNADTSQCEDDDECVLNTHNCGPGFKCRNIQGSFRCDRITCPPSQRLLSDGSCKVVVCGKGMEPNDAGSCIDINECARSNACRANQRCINTVGSYRCQNLLNCPPGYELNEFGNQCVDVDECARRIYECGPQQTCRNRAGGYICECPRGYALNINRECEDIDECTRFRGQVCSQMSECINTQGSYVCNCKEGFRKADDDKNCIDIDECLESPNLCQQTCNNVWGSYQCSCQAGYTLGADNRSCQDIDECKTYEGHGELCIGYCMNEPGSFSCSCPHGYRLSSDKRTCQDIDECQEQNVCSGDKQVCLNTRGAYKCNRIVCPPNYVRDKDHRNRCKKAIQECPFHDPECLNEPKSFSYNYITFVSNIRIPYSGQLDLFTMRGPRTTITTVEFNLQFKDARAPADVTPANRDFFHLRTTAYNEAMVSLIKSIQGPQDIELDLVLKMYHNGKFAGKAVAKIFIFVSEHKF